MADLAMTLMADGLKLAGAVQTNVETGAACNVDLTVLGGGAPQIRISQSLGEGATGCRLDSDALERVVAMAARGLTRSTDLLIVNKFGKQEAAGRGFRDLIGVALAEHVPVLIAVAPEYLDDFIAFAGEYATQLSWANAADWCRKPRTAAA